MAFCASLGSRQGSLTAKTGQGLGFKGLEFRVKLVRTGFKALLKQASLARRSRRREAV